MKTKKVKRATVYEKVLQYCKTSKVHPAYVRSKIRSLARGCDLSSDVMWKKNLARLKKEYGITLELLQGYYGYRSKARKDESHGTKKKKIA